MQAHKLYSELLIATKLTEKAMFGKFAVQQMVGVQKILQQNNCQLPLGNLEEGSQE
jgi:hypothetical protein